jgi:hypothetical protein
MIRTPDEPGAYKLPNDPGSFKLPNDPPPVSFDDVKIDFNVAPWRFKGVEGAVILNPRAIILSIEAQDCYDDIQADRPQRLGFGCRVVFAIPGAEGHSVIGNVCVMETPEQIEEQIRSRGGWKALP